MVKILKFSLIFLFTLAILGNAKAPLYLAQTFSRAKILSINTSDSTIKIVHFIGVDRSYYSLQVPKTAVIKKGDKKLKLSELKTGDYVSIEYTKDKDGNKIATSISFRESE